MATLLLQKHILTGKINVDNQYVVSLSNDNDNDNDIQSVSIFTDKSWIG
jgi:hypothetical protein